MDSLIYSIMVFAAIIIISGIRIINQYERGVVFRLGRVRKNIMEPGLRVIIPVIDQMRKVAMRTVTLPIETQK